MHIKQAILLVLIFLSISVYSQIPIDGTYGFSQGYTSSIFTKENGNFFLNSNNNVLTGKIKFTGKEVILEYPTEFKIEAHTKADQSNKRDSLVIRVVNVDMDTQGTITLRSLDSVIDIKNIAVNEFSIHSPFRERASDTVVVKLGNTNYSLETSYEILANTSELNIYVKDKSKYKSQRFDWLYGTTKNEILIDDKYVFYYLNNDGLVKPSLPDSKGFKKIKPLSSVQKEVLESDSEYILFDNDSAVVEEVVDSIYSQDESVDVMIEPDLEILGYPSESENYFLDKVNSLDTLKSLAKQKNKLIRIYYNTSLDIKNGLEIVTDDDYLFPANSLYIIQQYKSKDYKNLKPLNVKNVPQILILNSEGDILSSEQNPTRALLEQERGAGLLQTYITFLEKEVNRLRDKTEVDNPSKQDLVTCIEKVNILLGMRRSTSFTDEDSDALVYSLDGVKNFTSDNEIVDLLEKYFNLNYNYKLRGEKLPEAMVYIIKNSKTPTTVDRILNSSLSDGLNSVVAENIMMQVPLNKDFVIGAYLHNNLYGIANDSIDVVASFYKKYENEIVADSISGSQLYAKNFAIYLNGLAWKIYVTESVKYYEDALRWTDKALSLSSEAYILDTKAHILYKTGKKEEAIQIQRKALDAVKDSEMKYDEETLFEMKLSLELMLLDAL